MVKLGWSFSGKLGKDAGAQDGAAMDSVPLISPLDVSQLQPSFSDQVGSWAGGGPFSAHVGTKVWGVWLIYKWPPLRCWTAGQKPQSHMQSATSSPRASLGSSVNGVTWPQVTESSHTTSKKAPGTWRCPAGAQQTQFPPSPAGHTVSWVKPETGSWGKWLGEGSFQQEPWGVELSIAPPGPT